MAKYINDALDTLIKIKELLNATDAKDLRIDKVKQHDEDKIIQSSIDELRRLYDHTSNIYDQLRVKSLALIAGEVAIVTFIFSGDKAKYLPTGVDRQIFFFGGILMLVIAFGLLLWVISSVEWKMPHGLNRADKIVDSYKTPRDFLIYLHDDYVSVTTACLETVTKKCKKFNWVVYLLAGGVIILLIVTKFGGRI